MSLRRGEGGGGILRNYRLRVESPEAGDRAPAPWRTASTIHSISSARSSSSRRRSTRTRPLGELGGFHLGDLQAREEGEDPPDETSATSPAGRWCSCRATAPGRTSWTTSSTSSRTSSSWRATARPGEDPSIVGGFARFDGRVVLVMATEGAQHQGEHGAQLRHAAPRGLPQGAPADGAGRALREAHPHASSNAGRLPGLGAEERGQAEAIAVNLEVMSRLRVPDHLDRDRRGRLGGGALAIGVATAC